MILKAIVRISVLVCLMSTFAQAQAVSGYWEGTITHLNKNWKIGVEFETDGNDLKAYVDFIDIGGYHRLFTVTQKNEVVHFERQQPAGRPTLIFDGVIKGELITGTWSGLGIQGAQFSIHKTPKFTFYSEEVVFKNGDITLSGTLMLPDTKGPYPVVIFMHGGAPEERALFWGSALEFVKNGIGALIYDKRGVGKSVGGDWRLAGITGLAQDALAGVEMLKKRKEINPKKIGVYGHSEGGWTAPMAATLSKDIAFVIASAPSPVNAAEQSVYHRKEVMRAEGFSEEAIEKAAGIRERINAANKLCFTNPQQASIDGRKASEEIELIHKEPWLEASALPYPYIAECPRKEVLELLFTDPITIWQKVNVPVYLVWGDADRVVPVFKHAIISDALKKAGNTKVKIVIMPGVDHSITQIANPNEWDFPREPAEYTEGMIQWVMSLK